MKSIYIYWCGEAYKLEQHLVRAL